MPIDDTNEQRDSGQAGRPPAREEDRTQGAAHGGQDHASPDEGDREQREARELNEYTGTPGAALGPENESLVDEASAESFPASDPPAWTR